jgi:hypothetical protein
VHADGIDCRFSAADKSPWPERAAQEAARTLSPHNDRFKGRWVRWVHFFDCNRARTLLLGAGSGPKHTHLTKVLITDSTDYQNRHDAPSAAAPLEQPDGASHFRESPEPLR